MLRRKIFYIQVYPGHFMVRLHGQTRSLKRDCVGLEHPRTLAGDFDQIHDALMRAFEALRTPSMRLLRPDALVHLVPKAEGGYTSIELRAFKEAASAAGARRVCMCDDKYGPLNDHQVADVLGAAH